MSDPTEQPSQENSSPSSSLDPVLAPRSVAVIGASDHPARIGGRPLRYMREAGFKGAIYPVNPNRQTVQGLTAYASVAELPEAADCAIVALPAALVAESLRACAARGVRAAIIFSSGFAEMGADGRRLQEEVSAIARDSGMRVVGPNCLGLFNAGLGFLATFSSSIDGGLPKPGRIAIITQSGAYGSHVFALARAKGLGVGYWMSTGNECDVDVAEGIAWAAERDDIGVIVAYAEGVRDGPRLCRSLELARRRRKPVVFMKVGRSEIGAAAAASHTASLAGSDAVYDAVFRRHGVHRALGTEEMLDIAYALDAGILPAGKRVGLVTISGGVGVQMADAAVDAGLDVSPMPQAAQAKLKEILPYAAPRNPVDITAQAFNDLSLVSKNFELMLSEGGYDVILAFFTMVAASPYIVDELLERLTQLRQDFPDRLVILSIVARPEVIARYEAAGYPVFEDPGRAITAIKALCSFSQAFAASSPATEALPDVIDIPQRRLSEFEARQRLQDAGIPMLAARLAGSAGEAAAAAEALGLPVAMKTNATAIRHKSEIGGVILNVETAEAARETYAILVARAAAAAGGEDTAKVLVSPMAPPGVECLIGAQVDPVFGPTVAFGLGGIFVEIFEDVALRLAPFDADEAMAMMRELKGFPLLAGARGRPAADLEALAETLARFSRFAAAAAAQVSSIDLNPFLVLPKGTSQGGGIGLDALIVTRGEDPG